MSLTSDKDNYRSAKVRWLRMMVVGAIVLMPLVILIGISDRNISAVILFFVAAIAIQIYFFFFDKTNSKE